MFNHSGEYLSVGEGGVEGLADFNGNCVAPTRSSHQSCSQAAREMDKDKDCIL